MKPLIIVLSADSDEEFEWLSGGWNSTNSNPKKAHELMKRAKKAIGAGVDVPDVIAKLEAAGFQVTREEK